MPDQPEPLKFIVAPHIVQDLGLNLYTDLPRVLVEFVANAYDADSPDVRLTYDKTSIDEARKALKAAHPKGSKQPLEEMVLPETQTIVIEDGGHGMSRADLQEKFLVAGRRRREADSNDPEKPKTHSDGGRLLMGRKGLGKLAGFGVAQKVEIVTKKAGEDYATRIVLDYADLVKKARTDEIVIPDERLPATAIPSKQGTRITLSRLLYGPLQSRTSTVAEALGEHFMFIDSADFKIVLNTTPVSRPQRELAFAFPSPELPIHELIGKSYEVEGRTYAYSYRIRFTGQKQALPAKERGVRVYAHKRLAATPSLLKADTNMHGFRMTDYMDGVVKADFIDDERSDYVATDRQSLRWETPLLEPMYEFLSDEIKKACAAYQKVRDKEAEKEVAIDNFTKDVIDQASLSKKHTAIAYRIAAILGSSCKQGKDDPEYKRHLPIVVKGLGHGEIMSAIAQLSKEPSPSLDRAIAEITALTADEIDQQLSYIQGRLNAIEALRKIVQEKDFTKGRKEKKVQKLFEASPWLIDPTFFQFLSADKSEKSVNRELEKALKIGPSVPDKYDPDAEDEVSPGGTNLRPDLVFVLSNTALNRIVIVELKAPNTPLYGEHLRQLQGYIERAQEWCNERKLNVSVEGILIGSYADITSKAADVQWLRSQIKKYGATAEWKVFDFLEVLGRTEDAHHDLLLMRGEESAE